MPSLSKRFAQVTGVVLLLLGVIGLISGNYVFGINSSVFEDILHVVLGILGLVVGFSSSNAPAIQTVRLLGPVYLVVVVVGFIFPSIFGLVEPPLRIQDNIIHLLLGLIGTYAGYTDKLDSTTTNA